MIKEKQKQLKLTIDKIDKDFGKGSIMKLSEKPSFDSENVISTGSYSLDKCLGIGGLPKGRIVEIYGPESSGKTTLAMHIIANIQKAAGTAAIVDVEHAFDEEYAKRIGIDTDELLISQPSNGEEALEIVSRLIDSGALDVIVLDSVAALVPKSELEGQIGDSKMASQARLMGQTLRVITGKASKNNVLIIFINQLREKIGVMFGNPETTSGGNALKFYASIRIDIRKVGLIKDGDEIVGNKVKIKVIKNKVAPPFKWTEIDLTYGYGFDFIADVLDYAVSTEVIKQSGSWFSFREDKLGQGRDKVITLLNDNEDLLKEIKAEIAIKSKNFN